MSVAATAKNFIIPVKRIAGDPRAFKVYARWYGYNFVNGDASGGVVQQYLNFDVRGQYPAGLMWNVQFICPLQGVFHAGDVLAVNINTGEIGGQGTNPNLNYGMTIYQSGTQGLGGLQDCLSYGQNPWWFRMAEQTGAYTPGILCQWPFNQVTGHVLWAGGLLGWESEML